MTSAKPLGYRPSQTALEAAAARAAWRLAVLKRVVRILVVVILCIVSTVAALIWWDWRTDDLARQWIDGPHTDPISFIHINGGTPTGRLDVTLKDPGTLRALDQALKTPPTKFLRDLTGQRVEIEMRLSSGRTISTLGYVTPHSITWEPAEGDTWGGWDMITASVDDKAPRKLLDALSFAAKSSGTISY